jgi:hypothetical protein
LYTRIFLLITAFFISACIFEQKLDSDDVIVSFTLSDTTGREASVFKSGENFIVSFTVRNQSDVALTYDYSNPLIHYTIFQGDSQVCSSIDEMNYTAVVLHGKLPSASTLKDQWVAPNTPGRIAAKNRVTLQPGTYQIKVYHSPLFNEYRLPQTPERTFKITQ